MKTPFFPSGGNIVLYRPVKSRSQIDVRVEGETVWLSLNQIANVFGRDKSVISRHLRNVFSSGELRRKTVVAFFATTATDGKTYNIEYFNLDAILSVGYRVNSKRGTEFRIWATRTLREHLFRGFTLHERRLQEKGLVEIQQAVSLLANTLKNQNLVSDQGQSVLDVVEHYTRSWRLLREYDEHKLPETPADGVIPTVELSGDIAVEVISRLKQSLLARGEASELFGQERGNQLSAILGAIEQTFGGQPLYPTVQARAAHLFYFVIKDHPFSDGNKRIGSLLFLEYLRRNGLLIRPDGRTRFADNAVVALALLIAESDPRQKELLIRLVIHLIEGNSV